ncbi:MAG: metal-binding protein [Betaproteobacteria bacterium]|nr:metal-binding protein [Betaproteobacteria bacterium]
MGGRLGLALLLAWGVGSAVADPGTVLPPVTVYAPPVCLACIDWAEHLRQNGFVVTLEKTRDMPALKHRLKVPLAVESVHTARVGPYFVEGHVPADDIKQLLKEKPKARGLAVPGLPAGAPGREVSNPTCETACTVLAPGDGEKEVRREMYDTLLVGLDGKTKVFARH